MATVTEMKWRTSPRFHCGECDETFTLEMEDKADELFFPSYCPSCGVKFTEFTELKGQPHGR